MIILKLKIKAFVGKIKKQKAEIQKELSEKAIQEKIREELKQEEFLQYLYETKTGKNAIWQGRLTKGYLKWKEKNEEKKDEKELQDGEKSDIDDPFITYIKGLPEDLKKNLKRLAADGDLKVKNLKELRIERITKEVARLFPYDMILAAEDNDKEGAAVHGYLLNYDDYSHLIQKDYILDRAADEAMKDEKVTVLKRIKKVHFKDLVKTVVEWEFEERLDHKPHQPFRYSIFYAPEHLDYAVKWKEGVEKTIKGFDTAVTLGYANLDLIYWAKWNVPAFLVAHAPGKDYFVYHLEATKEEIEEEKMSVESRMISDLRKKQEGVEERIEEAEIGEKRARKRSTFAFNKMMIMQGSKVKQRAKELGGKDIQKIKVGDVLLVGALIVVVIFLIYIFYSSMGGVPPPTNSTLNETGTEVLRLVKKGFI